MFLCRLPVLRYHCLYSDMETEKAYAEELKEALIRVDDLLKVKDVLEKKFEEISQ